MSILLEDVAELSEKVCLFYTVTRQLVQIQQLCSSLSCHGILDTLKRHPHEAIQQFVYGPKASSPDLIRDLYEI